MEKTTTDNASGHPGNLAYRTVTEGFLYITCPFCGHEDYHFADCVDFAGADLRKALRDVLVDGGSEIHGRVCCARCESYIYVSLDITSGWTLGDKDLDLCPRPIKYRVVPEEDASVDEDTVLTYMARLAARVHGMSLMEFRRFKETVDRLYPAGEVE